MNDAVRQIAHDAVDALFYAPTDEPLIIQPLKNGSVSISRGIPATRMTVKAAHSFLGMSYNTFRKHYLDTKKVRVGTDGKISRKAIDNLFNELDGKD